MTFWTAVEPLPKYRSTASRMVASRPQLVRREGIERIGARHQERPVLHRERAEPVLAHVVGRQVLQEGGAGRKLLAADVGEGAPAGETLGDLLGRAIAQPDDRVSEPLAGRVLPLLGPGQVGLREEAGGGQPLAELGIEAHVHVRFVTRGATGFYVTGVRHLPAS
jgi:hypothetical protein